MPELPEVETICQGLRAALVGRQVAYAEVLRSESIAYPKPAAFSSCLTGHHILGVKRRGKYLLFELDHGATLVVHLGMSGRLLLKQKSNGIGVHLRVRILLDDRSELHFEDVRVFGRLWYIPKGKMCEEIILGLSKLGLEPLEHFTGQDLKAGFVGRRQAIKPALLDQRVVAGLGNIYADEALFKAKIHPTIGVDDLSYADWQRLAYAIKDVLMISINQGGSTLRDYTNAQGVNGSYQHYAWVYGRVNEPCRVCRCPIERIRLSGRSCHFCPSCQPWSKRKMLKTGSK